MKIYVDFDETIVESIKAVCTIYNNRYNEQANYKNVKLWSFLDECPRFKKGEASDCFSTEEFFNILEFKPNANFVLERLSKNNRVTIVTIGTELNCERKAIFIRNNLPFIKHMEFIRQDKTLVDKSSINMKGGMFIDDVAKYLNSTNAKTKILFENTSNAEWNKEWFGKRFSDWTKLEGLIYEGRYK